MIEKQYLDAQQLLEDSFKLAAMVYRSGFRPSFIVAVWRGGAPMGIAVQELLAYRGIHSDHITVRTSSYRDIDQQESHVQVYSMNYLIRKISADDRLLIVDDVYDTGRSVQAIIATLKEKTRRNAPHDIRVAVPYYKPSRNKTGKAPDYFLHETDRWLKFPHSLEGLSYAEVEKNRPELAAILKACITAPDVENRHFE